MNIFTRPLTKHDFTIPLALAIAETLGGVLFGVADSFICYLAGITSAGFWTGAAMVLARRANKLTGGDIAFLSVGWLILILFTGFLAPFEAWVLPMIGWHGLIPVQFNFM